MEDDKLAPATAHRPPLVSRAPAAWGFKVADMVEDIVRIAEIRGRACEGQVRVVEILRDMSLLS